MIWEVDEDSDGCVNLEEFQKMFYRGRNRIFERIDYKKDNKIDKEEVLTPHLSSLATLLCICTRTGV